MTHPSRLRSRFLALVSSAALAFGAGAIGPAQALASAIQPGFSDATFVAGSTTPPTESQCESVGRRCFTPGSIRAAYNLNPLYESGYDGTGETIAIVDSYGSDTIANDLHVYDQAFGLPAMCGETGVTCTSGMPTFSQLALQGVPATKAPPSTAKNPGQEDKAAWAVEVSLDVESAHAMAPGANILLVTTPTAETLGVQGFPQMMAAEDYVVQHHLADVISQSFGSSELAFGSAKSLLNLRYAFVDAAANGVTVLASTGDFGTANPQKSPVGKGGKTIPTPTVSWPASDPLVTAVGGTYLCTDPTNTTSRVLDNTDPPVNCEGQNNTEIGWIDSGGGYSAIFSRPAYQSSLPAGSTAIPSAARGIPDIALLASARTGPLIYLTLPPDGDSGIICPDGNPCSTGWYVIGGTSVSAPNWAGLVAIADQINGGDLGLINPALYTVASNPTAYAADFYDVTTGTNQTDPSVPGYVASTGWDPVTGLGTPNAALLLPDLVAASH